MDDSARDLGKKLGDPDRLLEGENPETSDPAEAEHWLSVYGELLELKREVTDQAKASAADLTSDAQPEADVDLHLLKKERERLEARHRFWEDRLQHLRAS